METFEQNKVLTISDKQYNKWHISEENQKRLHPSLKKGAVLVSARIVEHDELFGTYRYVIYRKSRDWNIELFYVIKDTSLMISVKELL